MDAETARETWYIEDGVLRWKIARAKKMKPGDPAGGAYQSKKMNTEYLSVGFKGKKYYVHRLVWLMTYGDWPKGGIDHIDGNGLNNKIENLRDVAQSENTKNRRLNRNNKSGQCGVHWFKQTSKWRADIKIDGRKISLGYFDDFNDAVEAREEAELKYGFHQNHGKVRAK
jgi:hypothetical protein